jgi:hypothetical protein
MVTRNRKGDDQPRTAPERKAPTFWENLMQNHGEIVVPIGLLLAIIGLFLSGTCGSR